MSFAYISGSIHNYLLFRKLPIHRLTFALLFLSIKGDINKGVKIIKKIIIQYFKIITYFTGTLTFLSRGYSRKENRFPREQVLKHIFKLTLDQEVQCREDRMRGKGKWQRLRGVNKENTHKEMPYGFGKILKKTGAMVHVRHLQYDLCSSSQSTGSTNYLSVGPSCLLFLLALLLLLPGPSKWPQRNQSFGDSFHWTSVQDLFPLIDASLD